MPHGCGGACGTWATGPSPSRGGIVRPVLSGFFAAAAYLTRSIGVSLLVAIIAAYLLRRRWKQAAAAAVAPLLAFVGWRIWCAWAASANAGIPGSAAFRYDLDYGLWLPGSVGALANTVPVKPG